jgi:hypothetical protein
VIVEKETMKAFRACLCASALAFATHVDAAPITFSFDTATLSGPAQGNGLGQTGGSSAIASYMNGVLSANGIGSASVAVSGAQAVATNSGSSRAFGATPTLGALAGNNSFGIGTGSTADSIMFVFSNLTVSSLSFDWVTGSDLKLYVDNVLVWHKDGAPGNGASTFLDLAALGLPGGGHALMFVNGPAEFAIDNLIINGECTPATQQCAGASAPEPSSLALLAVALCAALVGTRRRAEARDR